MSVELNLRPPRIALWTGHDSSGYEVALLLLLLGAVFLHRLPLLTALAMGELTQKIGRQPWLKLLPQHGVTVGLTTLLWRLIV